MEYKTVFYVPLGFILLIVWGLNYWSLFKKSPLIAISNNKKNDLLKFLKFGLFGVGVLGIFYLTYALSFPRSPLSFSSGSKEVNDIFLVVDVSRSMLAEDLNPNRLEVAKQKLRDFAGLRPRDRFGIIIFSEKVFTLLPLTTDTNLIAEVVEQINVGDLGSGTNIGDALGLGVARAQASDTKNKIIILLTDGVNNVGTLTPLEAANKAKEYKIKVYTIGLASDKDARLPMGQGIFGTTYQKIPGGSIDMETLQEISKITGGKSFRAKNENSLKEILEEIEKLERTEIKVTGEMLYKELYYEYLLIGVLLFLISEFGRIFLLREIS